MKLSDVRALRLGATVIVAGILTLRIGPWCARTIGSLRERATESLAAAQRAQQLLEESPSLRDSLARALTAVVGLAPDLVEGRSAAEAGATLAGLISAKAQQHSLRVVRLDPVVDSGGGVFARVFVRAELEGDLRGLAGWLRALESGNPVLTLALLGVSAPDPVTAGRNAERLRIEATVAALYWPRVAS